MLFAPCLTKTNYKCNHNEWPCANNYLYGKALRIMKNKQQTGMILVITALLIVGAIGVAITIWSSGGGGNVNLPVTNDTGYEEVVPGEPSDEAADETPPDVIATINIAPAGDELRSGFAAYREFDFREAYIAHWGGDVDWLTINSPVAIWADVPLRDFEVIGLENNFLEDGTILSTAAHVYYSIAILDTPLIINWYFFVGMFPNNGISFTDTDGSRRFFAIRGAYGYDGEEPFTLMGFENGGVLFPPWEGDSADEIGEAPMPENNDYVASAAADNSNAYELCHCGEHYVHEELRQPTPPLNIRDEDVSAEFLSAFAAIHTYTFIQWETDQYSTLVLWPDEVLHDFSFVYLGFNETDGGGNFYIHEVLLVIGELPPTEAVVVNVAFEHYLIPRGGIVFTDESGTERRMFISESMRGGCFPLFNLIPHDESNFADWN